MTRRAVVVGMGVAGLTCARLLADRGWVVQVWDLGDLADPPLVLNEVTGQLLRDLWGPAPLTDAHRLDTRMVRWHPGPPTAVPQAGLVVDGATLRRRLLERLAGDGVEAREVPPVELAGQVAALGRGTVVDASGRAARVTTGSGAARELIGHRQVVAASVRLRPSARQDTCHMETVPGGWVFLAPTGGDRAVLQAMSTDTSTPPDDVLTRLLAGTELIDAQIMEIRGPASAFPAGPQRCAPSAGETSGVSWIAIGDAAIALDPVAGDGVGHGLRGALLAVAVLDTGRADAVEHYRSRLDEAFSTHLRRCLACYAGFDGPGWAREQAAMERAARELGRRPEPLRYGLSGRRLVPLHR
ncbi:MAG: NAD(P)/FAD-dependent oxidoreductase [Pseudonocardia sp.]